MFGYLVYLIFVSTPFSVLSTRLMCLFYAIHVCVPITLAERANCIYDTFHYRRRVPQSVAMQTADAGTPTAIATFVVYSTHSTTPNPNRYHNWVPYIG
jgi:hypothetical protein